MSFSSPGLGQIKTKYNAPPTKATVTTKSNLASTAANNIKNAEKASIFSGTGAPTTTTSVRAYGSRGWEAPTGSFVHAQRTIAQGDKQSHQIIRNNNIRANLYQNLYFGAVNNGYKASTNYMNSHNNDMDTYTKFMMGIQLGQVVAQSGIELLNAIHDSKGSDSSSGSSSIFKTVNTGYSSIDAMSNASDSRELRKAISDAESRMEGLPKDIKKAEGELKTLKDATGGLRDAKKTADDNLTAHNQKLSEARQSVDGAKSGAVRAASELNTATEALDAANEELTKYRNMNAEGNTAIKGLIAAAEAKVATCQAAKDTAEANKKKADALLEQQENRLQQLNEQTKGLEDAAKSANQALEDNIKEIEKKEASIEKMQKEETKLKSAIEQKKKKLAQMEKNERKELDNIENKIKKLQDKYDKLIAKIDSNDSDKKDAKYQSEANDIQKEIQGLQKRKAELESLCAESSA